MRKYLVDTNILIDHLRGVQKATNFLLNNENLVLPYICLGELFQGARNKKDLGVIEKLVKIFDIDWGSPKINKNAVKLLKQYSLKNGILLLDAIIASMAIDRKLALYTKNTKDFKFISKIEVESPY